MGGFDVLKFLSELYGEKYTQIFIFLISSTMILCSVLHTYKLLLPPFQPHYEMDMVCVMFK